eukprot:m.228897 g.228897  ORF g.228897 m.228897 type:complete len:80 (-) comp25989_c0_seq3:589-828(-)
MLGFGGPPALPMDPEMAAAWDAYTECALDGDNPVARGLYAPQLYVTPGVGNHCTTMVSTTVPVLNSPSQSSSRTAGTTG